MDLVNKDDFSKATNLEKWKLEALSSPLMKLLKIDEINRLYRTYGHLSGYDFTTAVLNELEVNFQVNEKDLENIPKEGAFILIANHPYGGIDGLMLLNILIQIRPDFKVMANFLLQKIQSLENYIIPVNPFDNNEVEKSSLAGIKKTIESLKAGTPIGFFPAGEVSSFQNNSRLITDREWKPIIGKIISKANVPVIPLHFSGTNSYLFNILGMIHPAFRTAKLPSELFNKKGNTIKIRIGKAINPKNLSQFVNNDQLVRYLRARTYAISSPLEVKKFFTNPFKISPKIEDIIPETNQEAIVEEVNKLIGTDNFLCSQEQVDVFVAFYTKIPNILNEIGRLREITFREVGEGTNKSIDLDEFDLYYHHLFMWDREKKKIIGAYRIGKGNDIYRKFNKKGFYLNTLFKMEDGFVPILRESLEMGRSFVRKEYQQKPFSLFLLWKGILIFLEKNKEYRYLIGPVSISNNFSVISKALITQLIKRYFFDHELAKLISPRAEFKFNEAELDTEILLKSDKDVLKSLDELISDIEPSSYRIPVLLKKYLKQNAKIIGFNTDPKFSDTLDGFVIMDFQTVPKETLKMLEKE